MAVKVQARLAKEMASQRRHILNQEYQEDYLERCFRDINSAVEDGKFEVHVEVPIEYTEYIASELRAAGYKCRYVKSDYRSGFEIWWGNQKKLPFDINYNWVIAFAVVAVIAAIFIFAPHR